MLTGDGGMVVSSGVVLLEKISLAMEEWSPSVSRKVADDISKFEPVLSKVFVANRVASLHRPLAHIYTCNVIYGLAYPDESRVHLDT
jgi:hypothetical protein